VLVAADPLRRARPGRRLPVRVTLQRRGGGRRTVTVRVRVPRGLPRGRVTLVLSGNGFAEEPGLIIEVIEEQLAGAAGAARGSRPRAAAARRQPRTARRLARRLARMRRPLGIEARFGRGPRRVVLRSDDVRFDGRVKLSLRVLRARR
jgi:hypothetical protein